MSLDWNSGELAAGLACYRDQEFFEAHEHWESVWMQLEDPEKHFMQGLIQLTVAFHHYQRANLAGALSLLRRALRRLEHDPARFGGIEVATLSAEVREWVGALEKEGASFPAAYPRITPVERQYPI